jgi:hypothetical protein
MNRKKGTGSLEQKREQTPLNKRGINSHIGQEQPKPTELETK